MARHQRETRSAREKSQEEGGRHGNGSPDEAGERMGREASRTQAQMQEGARQFASMGEQAFEAWMRNGNELLRRVLEVNMELANWGREQLDDSINAARSLAQCRTMGDAYGVQIGLMRSSMEKSLRHASNVMNLATHAMVGGMQRSQRAGSAAAREMQSGQRD